MKSLALATPLFLAPSAALAHDVSPEAEESKPSAQAEAYSGVDALPGDGSSAGAEAFTGADPYHGSAGVDTGGFSVAATSALNQIDDLVALGRPVTGGICTFEHTVGTLPLESALRARISRLIEDFRDRAARAFIGFEDVAVLRTKYVQARIDSAIADLYDRAVREGWSREKYASELKEWMNLSTVFDDAPDPSAYRERFQQAVKPAIQNAKSIARLHQSMQKDILEKRVRWAIKVAQARMAASTFLPADEMRVLELIEQWRALVEVQENDPDC